MWNDNNHKQCKIISESLTRGKDWQHNNIYLGVALDENKNALAESIKKLLADNGVNNALVNNNLPQLISRGNVN